MPLFSLSIIGKSYDRVVLDSSAVMLRKRSERRTESYAGELKTILGSRNFMGAFVTLEEVYEEASRTLREGDIELEHMEFLKSKIVSPEIDFEGRYGRFSHILRLLTPRAKALGIFDKGVKTPETDVRIASLALYMSHYYSRTAFLTGDGKLADMVLENRSDPRLASNSGGLDVYFFLQRESRFVERAHFNEIIAKRSAYHKRETVQRKS